MYLTVKVPTLQLRIAAARCSNWLAKLITEPKCASDSQPCVNTAVLWTWVLLNALELISTVNLFVIAFETSVQASFTTTSVHI